MKNKYFYNDDDELIIADEKTVEQAEAGKNYLRFVASWWDLGEFETADQARQKYEDLQADARFCLATDC